MKEMKNVLYVQKVNYFFKNKKKGTKWIKDYLCINCQNNTYQPGKLFF
jgi:hypothetical protein